MNKKLLLLIALLSIGISYAYATDTNDVCFVGPEKGTTIKVNYYNIKDYSITKGKTLFPTASYKTDTTEKTSCIVIQADRKNDSSNVTWVKNNMQSQGIFWTDEYMVATIKNDNPFKGENIPDSLNFAVKGNLSVSINNVEYTCDDIQLGQGHVGVHNNWWIFSNTPRTGYPYKWSLTCTNQNTGMLTYIYPYSTGDAYTFSLKFDAPKSNPSTIGGHQVS